MEANDADVCDTSCELLCSSGLSYRHTVFSHASVTSYSTSTIHVPLAGYISADLLLTSALSPVHSLYHHLFCSLIVNVAGRTDCPSVWDLKLKYNIYVTVVTTVLLSHAYDRRGLPSCPPYQGPYYLTGMVFGTVHLSIHRSIHWSTIRQLVAKSSTPLTTNP